MTPTAHAILILALLITACGDDGGEVPESPPPAVEAASERPEGPEREPGDPCALLTEALLRGTFEIPADTPVQNSASEVARHRSCAYVWDKPNAEEVRAEVARIQQERIQEMVAKMRRGKRAQGLTDLMDLPRVENRVSFNFGRPSESAEAARVQFDEAGAMLARGLTHRVEPGDDTEGVSDAVRREMEGESVTFQADSESVEGVGDSARWTPRLSQLAVLDGTRILYLTVEMDVDRAVNLERAKLLARAMID